MPEKVLFVDDDVNILSGFQRNLRNRFSVTTADSGEKALQILRMDSSFAVIVADFRMPVMNGVELFARTSAEWPHSVRVLMTGEADTRAAAAAVNQGHIFRFLTKPCPALTLEKTLTEAIKYHDLITAEKVLLERTLRGSMEVLSEILNLLHPVAFSRSSRIHRIAVKILSNIDVPNKWELEIAAMLAHIGCVGVPLDIVTKVCNRKVLTPNELAVYNSHPRTGARLLEKIPRLELVAQIIASQGQNLTPLPAWQDIEKVDRLDLGCHLLKLAIDVEEGTSREMTAPALLTKLSASHYHPAMLKAAEEVIEELGFTGWISLAIPSRELECGMILETDIIGENGLLLMAKGQFLTLTNIQFLQRRFQLSGTDEIVRVRQPSNQHEFATIEPY